jgi:hypothetical protein
MELSSIQHIDPEHLPDIEADVFLTTLGFESRCTTVARRLEKLSCRKVAFARTDHIKEHAFQENQAYYSDQGYEIVPVESKVPDMEAIFRGYSGEKTQVILDSTSMSARWYFEFFRWFSEEQDHFTNATIRIAYTMPAYTGHEELRKVKSVKAFMPSEQLEKDGKKTALFLGLGHEKNIAESIYKKMNPDRLYLLYADPPADKSFVDKVFVNNHALINSIPIKNLIAYPIRNGQDIYQTLIDLVLPLRKEYRIILMPKGPKLLSIVAQLIHLSYPDIQIFYPEFKKPPAVDQLPSGEPVVLDVRFEGEE